MKSKTRLIRSALSGAALLAAGTTIAYSQTITINPEDSIPATHTLVFQTEWNSDGNMEGWNPNDHYVLEGGAPFEGIVTGTAAGVDPTLTRTGLNVATDFDTIIEFSIRKEAADTTRIDLFWADDSGGFGGPRYTAIPSATFGPNDEFKIVRLSYSGQMNGPITAIRLDPSADAGGDGKVSSYDYIRVYSVVTGGALSWNPGAAGGTAGGDGLWNTVANNWWDGTAKKAWPNNGLDAATFGGTAGTVTIAPVPQVTASEVTFATTGYTLTGAPLILENAAVIRAPGVRFTLNAPLAGNSDITITGNDGSALFRVPSQHFGSLRLNHLRTAATVDEAFGSGPVFLGNGGNVFLSAIGGDRTFSNDFEWRGNRLIIDGDSMGLGDPAGGVIINGELMLAGQAPSDFFLRRSLTVNGIVGGTGPGDTSLVFNGDSNVMTLTAPQNFFFGDIVWMNNTRLAVVSDAGLGELSNALRFNSGAGGVRLLAGFDSARPLNINGDTGGLIDTNGFNSNWSGNITGQAGVNSRFLKAGAGTLTLTGTANLGGGTQVQGGELVIPASASLVHGASWDNNHGVAGAAKFLLDGGSFQINSSFFGVGNGIREEEEAVMQMNGGTYSHIGGQLLVGFRGAGRFILNGGTATINQLAYGDGNPARTAVVELNGGTLNMSTAARRHPGLVTATIRFNGTTVIARDNNPDFLQLGTEGTTKFIVGAGGAIFNTPTSNIGINAELEHDSSLAGADGGVTKLGAGSLFFARNQSYTGPTLVSGGTLGGNATLTSNTTVGAGAGLAARINQVGGTAGTAHSLLAINGSLTLPSPLVIKILPGPDGFLEAAASGMTIATATGGITGFDASKVTFDTTSFPGSGTWSASSDGNSIVLAYGTGAAGGFAEFVSSIPNANLRGPLDDPDGDGVENLLEYVLGGSPSVSDVSVLPVQAMNGSALVLSFNRSVASAADTTVRVETSTNLIDWTPAQPNPVTATGAVSVTIPRNLETKLFVRLRAVLNP